MGEQREKFGALVISLDFELHWGLRDLYSAESPHTNRILNAREVIPKMIDLFEKYEVAATWAVVGYLFAKSRAEIEMYSPKKKPHYLYSHLDPYQEKVGETECDDPLHYAPTLIKYIQQYKRQEIATHTFSHYYCLEKGQTAETFAADLDSAIAIAKEYGITIRSIVFPRNQYNPKYEKVLSDREIICYRGNEKHPIYQVNIYNYNAPYKRMFRLLDSYLNLSGMHLVSWDRVMEDSGLCNIAASRFFRPPIKGFSLFRRWRVKRIVNSIYAAAKSKQIFHLWWHPHNFGNDSEERLTELEEILYHFKICQEEYGMKSFNLAEAAELVTSQGQLLKKSSFVKER